MCCFKHIKMEALSTIMKTREIHCNANSQRKDIIRAIIGSVVFIGCSFTQKPDFFKQIMFSVFIISLFFFFFFPPFLPQGAKSCVPLKTNLCSYPAWKPVNHVVMKPPRDFCQLWYVPQAWILNRRLHTHCCRTVFPASLDQLRLDRNTVFESTRYG